MKNWVATTQRSRTAMLDHGVNYIVVVLILMKIQKEKRQIHSQIG